MMKNTARLLTLLSGIILTVPVLLACPEDKVGGKKGELREKVHHRMRSIDTNQDRMITYEEARVADATHLLEKFNSIDSDGDGSLSHQELRDFHEKMRSQKNS